MFALLPLDVHLDEGYIDINKTLVYAKFEGDTKKEFHIETPKTTCSNRRIPINSDCREHLNRRGVLDVMDYFTGHTFRHTFATRCFEAGIQPKVVQKYLGHATLQMTMDLYTHVTDELAQEDIEKISLADI